MRRAPWFEGTVVVVGAGMAGLAASRQLMQLGHRVVVLEGRDRAGGRVWTRMMSGVDPKTGTTHRAGAEMGGSILTGADSNPLCILARQLDLTWHVIRDPCPLYTKGGAVVDKSIDDKVYKEHNAMLDRLGEWRQETTDPLAINAASLGRELDSLRDGQGP